MSDSTERRQFSRIPFEANAHIKTDKAPLPLTCHVLDISLKGILVTMPTGWQGEINDKFAIELSLEDGQFVIKMETSVAHIDDHTLGLLCEHISLDDMSHLKRLVELNLGSEDILNRELSDLIN